MEWTYKQILTYLTLFTGTNKFILVVEPEGRGGTDFGHNGMGQDGFSEKKTNLKCIFWVLYEPGKDFQIFKTFFHAFIGCSTKFYNLFHVIFSPVDHTRPLTFQHFLGVHFMHYFFRKLII